MFTERIYKLNQGLQLNIDIKWLLKVILLGLLTLFPAIVYAQDAAIVYTVKPGDSLSKIAASYGSTWKGIFGANRDNIQDPNIIYTGQKLLIPSITIKSEEPSASVDKELSKVNYASESKEPNKVEDPNTLEKFRQVFNKVVKQETQNVKDHNTSTDYNLNIGGLIINETRSKMGSNFYNVFYQHWNAPENAGNFILTITEQPVPSMGTLVTVKIDNKQVFKTRLQPRYAVIEQLAKQAIAVTYYSLYQQLSISSQITSY